MPGEERNVPKNVGDSPAHQERAWSGITLPEGLTSETASRAAALIYNWADDWPGHENQPGYGLKLEELVVGLYCIFCAPGPILERGQPPAVHHIAGLGEVELGFIPGDPEN